MDQSQYELCSEVLRRLEREGVLRHVVIIGSWCMLSYGEYFRDVEYHAAVRTRDLDILVPVPARFTRTVDVQVLLRDLDFVTGFRGEHGCIVFTHPDLSLEFLVPEQGRGSDKPYPLPALGANAQRLRYLGFLLEKTILGRLGGVRVRLPHPARFAVHKLIVSTRRQQKVKRENDRNQGVYVLERLLAMRQDELIRTVFRDMPAHWGDLACRALSEAPRGEAILRVMA